MLVVVTCSPKPLPFLMSAEATGYYTYPSIGGESLSTFCVFLQDTDCPRIINFMPQPSGLRFLHCFQTLQTHSFRLASVQHL